MNAPFGQKGFTLLEVLLVVFVIAVAVAMALPSFHGLLSRDISSEARTVASIIRYLNDTSMNTKAELAMVVNLDGRRMTYPVGGTERSKEIAHLHAVESASAGARQNGEVTLRFGQNGLAERLRVRLSDRTIFKDVEYNPYSGRVTIEERPAREEEPDAANR